MVFVIFYEQQGVLAMVKMSNMVQLVTPDQAAVWLEAKYTHQRKENPTHTAHLVQAMHDDTFSPVNTIMFSVLGGQQHLINGQHTLLAIIKSKKPQTLPIAFYVVENEIEEAQLYFRIDRQRQRNFSDSVRATGLGDSTGLTPTMIQKTATAMRHIKANFGGSSSRQSFVSDDDLMEWIPFWEWETKAIWNAISPCTGPDRNMILSQAVFSVALITMRYQPKKAREFWRQVAQDDGLDRYDSRKTIRAWLLSRRATSRNSLLRTRENEISRAVALAWNAYIEDRMLRFIVIRDKLSILKILGTSYSGAQGGDFLPLYTSPNIDDVRLSFEQQKSAA